MSRFSKLLASLFVSLICVVFFASLVACASEPISMPDMSGKNFKEAKTELEDLGFSNIDTKKEDGSNPMIIIDENWIVIAQDPTAGTAVDIRSTITLTVKNVTDIEVEEQAKQEMEAAQEEQSIQAEFDSIVGQSYLVAHEKLTSLGYTAKWVHAVSGMDFTDTLRLDIENPDSEFALPWIVTGYKSLDTGSKTIILQINAQENTDRVAAEETIKDKLTAKLEPSVALGTVLTYGKQQYPYGFELNMITGQLAETAEDENTWFFKYTCDVTNMYGVEAKGLVCEARVTGTTDAPVVTSFNVY